jgi:ferric-dicitrate binding protein FerR (iron transport regulator)
MHAKPTKTMKLNTNIPQHSETIAKYILGEMSTSEMQQFEETISAHPENEKLINEMRKDWNMIGQVKQPNADKAWEQLYSRFEQESLLESNKTVPIVRKEWMSWAAAILILVTVGSVYLFSGALSNSVVVETTSDPNTLVHSLSDGSTVYLSANSKLTFSKKFGRKNRQITLSGEAFFDVAKNAKMPFIIETDEADVKVLGTSFTVKSNRNAPFEVTVKTGTVSISQRNNNDAVIATAGYKVELVNNQLTKSLSTLTDSPIWQNQRLQFKDETLANLVLVINKTYNSNITIDPTVDGNRKLTVTFYNNSIQSIVDVICATLSVEAKFDDNTILLWKP